MQSCHGDAQCCIPTTKVRPRGCCLRRRTCPRVRPCVRRRSQANSSRRRGNRYSRIREPGRRGRVARGRERASTSANDAREPARRGIATTRTRVHATAVLRRGRRDASPRSIGAFPETVLANTMTKMAALGSGLAITYPRAADREERSARTNNDHEEKRNESIGDTTR